MKNDVIPVACEEADPVTWLGTLVVPAPSRNHARLAASARRKELELCKAHDSADSDPRDAVAGDRCLLNVEIRPFIVADACAGEREPYEASRGHVPE